MILSKRAALNGVQLDELFPEIVIRSVDPGVPHETVSAVSRGGGFGQRVTGQHWDTLEVSVTYAIDVSKREMPRRRQIFDAVNTWALGKGWLTVNWMEGRRFYVDKVVIPGSGDLWRWTDEYTIIFRAYGVPFWQDEIPAQAVSSVTGNGSVTVQVGGNVKSVLDISFQNRSGMVINNFQVQTGSNVMAFSNLNLGGSAELKIWHGTDGLLRITANGSPSTAVKMDFSVSQHGNTMKPRNRYRNRTPPKMLQILPRPYFLLRGIAACIYLPPFQ